MYKLDRPKSPRRGFVAIASLIPPTFVVSAVILLGGCNRSSLKPPDAVVQSFAARHPNASATWEEQPYGYEAVFSSGGMEYEAEFSADGRWLETEQEVTAAEFSQVVLDRIKRDYPGYAITKYEIEQTPQGRFYEVEIERDGSEYELYFDPSANPVTNANEDG